MKWFLTILSSKPAIGARITGGSFSTGLFLRIGYTPDFHHMVNDCLQTLAFLITIVVGVITVVSWIRKNKTQDTRHKTQDKNLDT